MAAKNTAKAGEKGGEEPIALDEAARRAGLHYMTVYRHVRTGRLPAQQRGGRWWVDPADLDQLQARGRPGRGAGAVRWSNARRRLVDRMVAADEGGTWTLLEEVLARGATPADLYVRLLGPALEEVGRGWASGAMTVGDEHCATLVAMRMIGRLAPRFVGRGRPNGGTVLLGGAPGDPHLVPVVMVADLLRSRRVRVMDLGANVPEGTFLAAAAAVSDLRAVGVSLSDDALAPATASVLRALRRRHRDAVLLAGGPGLPAREDALALGADDWAPDGLAAADILSTLQPARRRRS